MKSFLRQPVFESKCKRVKLNLKQFSKFDNNMNIIKVVLLIISLSAPALSLSNGLALTPPLLLFASAGCQADETFVLQQAELLISLGFASKGYKYVLIESCWQGSRDKYGKIQEDPNKFPSGIKALVSQLHSKGLQVGLTTDIGSKTSCGKQGSQGYESIDVDTYVSWGIDYVRIQNSQNISGARQRMTIFTSFLIQTGRRIMISIDNQGKQATPNWGSSIANTWTTGPALNAAWSSLTLGINKQIGLQSYAGEGAWNDAGFLLSSLPLGEFITQYAIWVCVKSPLALTDKLQDLDKEKLRVLLNTELLSIHQDSLKEQGKLVLKEEYSKGWQQVWGCRLSNKRYLLVFVNGMAEASRMQVSLKNDVGLVAPSYWVRDPLNQITIGSSSTDLLAVDKVASHGVELRVVNL